jgi:hypothetical protein
MSQSMVATYENGLLRPATPVLGFTEGQRVWITIDDGSDLAAIEAGIKDMEAGRVVPFEQVDARLRAKLGLPHRA